MSNPQKAMWEDYFKKSMNLRYLLKIFCLLLPEWLAYKIKYRQDLKEFYYLAAQGKCAARCIRKFCLLPHYFKINLNDRFFKQKRISK